MFRRLAEAFQDDDGSHPNYMKKQNTYFNTLPNIILSGTSGLKGFDTAIQSLDSMGQNYQPPAVKNPNNIFVKDSSPDLNAMAKECSSSSLDQLIAIKNPNAAIGCGWLYTPPNKGSPYPVVSQGFIGNSDGPLQNFEPSDYKKYFFDLQLAKKQILLDKCKALKACTDVDSEVFNGTCGYCTDTNQGVPIDTVGQSLYGNDPIGACSPQSIITSGQNCPPPPGSGSGPQPIIDKTCEPVNGRLSSACLYNQVLAGGCSDNGTLAIALTGNPSPNDYVASIRDGDAVKIYNRVANPPLKLDIFTQGATTVDQVLKEVRQLAGNAKLPSNTGTGAAARDLCLQKGAINGYNFCLDLPDTTTSPFDIGCLQQIFRKLGGQPTGISYPQSGNINFYNSLGNLGAVKQYFNSLIQNMSSSDYNTQRTAMLQFLGIQPEKLIQRAPYQQGVEVFWFVPIPGQSNKVIGFLRRTIERDFVQFNGTGIIPQIGFSQFSTMLQLTDIRAPTDFSNKFTIQVDDGFWIAVNQPANIDSTAFGEMNMDTVGLFGNLGIQGPTTYQSNSCSNFYAAFPNITKMYYDDCGGGNHTFVIANITPCSGTPSFTPPYYSLTCEPRAPFLNYEVSLKDGTFQETRNPGIFGQFLGLRGLEYHMRTEETNNVPGNKGFVRLNSANSCINMPNIAFQSWGTVTFCIRPQSMPVKETLLNLSTGPYYYNLIATPTNGNNIKISIEHNLSGSVVTQEITSGVQLSNWYLFTIINNGTSIGLNLYDVASIVSSKGSLISNVVVTQANGQLYQPNATWNPAPGQPQAPCNIMVGTNGYMNWRGMYSTSSFNYDLAWIHFYDYALSANDFFKEASASWIFTQFPDALNTYKTLG
jgi:hypothetical protein